MLVIQWIDEFLLGTVVEIDVRVFLVRLVVSSCELPAGAWFVCVLSLLRSGLCVCFGSFVKNDQQNSWLNASTIRGSRVPSSLYPFCRSGLAQPPILENKRLLYFGLKCFDIKSECVDKYCVFQLFF